MTAFHNCSLSSLLGQQSLPSVSKSAADRISLVVNNAASAQSPDAAIAPDAIKAAVFLSSRLLGKEFAAGEFEDTNMPVSTYLNSISNSSEYKRLDVLKEQLEKFTESKDARGVCGCIIMLAREVADARFCGYEPDEIAPKSDALNNAKQILSTLLKDQHDPESSIIKKTAALADYYTGERSDLRELLKGQPRIETPPEIREIVAIHGYVQSGLSKLDWDNLRAGRFIASPFDFSNETHERHRLFSMALVLPETRAAAVQVLKLPADEYQEPELEERLLRDIKTAILPKGKEAEKLPFNRALALNLLTIEIKLAMLDSMIS